MRIFDILTSPWAIVPDKLQEIQEIYATHLRGEKIDIKAVEAMIGKPLNNEREPYQIINDVAVIPIHGIIAKRMNLFSQISGGVSTQILAGDIKDAIADPAIKGLLLDVDSPGGTVDGTEELAQVIFKAREEKPIVTYTDGMMASAALWIGSAAHKAYISGDTVSVGSIGVVASHVDYSEMEKREGVKTTEIYAGKFKRIASQYEPLSPEGRASIQESVDYIYSVFVETVAKHRGVSTETVLSDMAEGRQFIGRQAITAGLVDGVSTFDRLIHSTLPAMWEKAQAEQQLNILNKEIYENGPKGI